MQSDEDMDMCDVPYLDSIEAEEEGCTTTRGDSAGLGDCCNANSLDSFPSSSHSNSAGANWTQQKPSDSLGTSNAEGSPDADIELKAWLRRADCASEAPLFAKVKHLRMQHIGILPGNELLHNTGHKFCFC